MTTRLVFRLSAFLAAALWLAAPVAPAQDDDVLPKKGEGGRPQLPLEEPRTKVMRDKLTGWLEEHASVKALPNHAGEAFDKAFADGNTFRYALGSELTDTETPYLIDCWDNRLYFHALSAEQAKAFKLGPRSAIQFAPTARQRARRLASPLVQLEAATITGGKSVDNLSPIKGKVTLKASKAPAGKYTLRMSYRRGSAMTDTFHHLEELPEAGEKVSFSFSAVNRADDKDKFTGPLPVYIDLVTIVKKETDFQITIYSNTLPVLLDVTAKDE
ncbi:MAG: hypothetical protein K2P78_10220 [Gemmataceae bacterium]|nr:hypothetical protein [Gemmataceae bacterium]